MNHLEMTKSSPGSAGTTAGSIGATNQATTAVLRLDTLGYDYASIDVLYGPTSFAAGTNSSVASVLTLKHSDSQSTGYDTIAGYPTVSAPASSANTASSTSSTLIRFDVDMRGRKRYLEVTSSPHTTAVVAMVARLGKGEVGPASASEKGVAVTYAG